MLINGTVYLDYVSGQAENSDGSLITRTSAMAI